MRNSTVASLAPVALVCLLWMGGVASIHAQEQPPGVDANGNGGGASVLQPSKPLETDSAALIFSCNSPVSGNDGLTWDGTFLWIADYDTKRAYTVDPSTCAALRSIPLPGTYPTGLAWDGRYLWHADGDAERIYRLDPSDGAIVSSFPSPGGFPHGLTWDGGNLWNSDSNCNHGSCTPDQILKLATTGGLLAAFSAPGAYPTGLAYDGLYLWHSDNATDTIYKLRRADLSIVDSFPSPGTYPNDLAWDGRYLWVVDNGTDMLYQYDVGHPLKVYLPLIAK